MMVCAGVLEDRSFPKGFAPGFADIYSKQRAPFYLPGVDAFGGGQAARGARGGVTGSCSCGRCQFSVRQLEGTLQHCHCGMCRQMSGSAFQTWVAARLRELTWTSRDSLRKLRTSAHACREVCTTCGAALTILYDGQRGTAWLAAAALDRGAFPVGVASENAQHICVAYSAWWNPPSRWPSDGLRRIQGVYEGDRVPLWAETGDTSAKDAELKEALRRSTEGANVGNGEQDEMQEALRRSVLARCPSNSGATAAAASPSSSSSGPAGIATPQKRKAAHASEGDRVPLWAETGDTSAKDAELKEALRRSTEGANVGNGEQDEMQEALRRSVLDRCPSSSGATAAAASPSSSSSGPAGIATPQKRKAAHASEALPPPPGALEVELLCQLSGR
eukprot:CAMPEP_0183606624 /NCGR_PEP_ID=MMETSP0371-20130417/183048_1 /TAXON_ID=268820 /ORGANISM="Peridinium aciculiferum, Strain PAER-2" /LENGTH=389 /DNA_ID=CAMNT_0025818739 /DNA_START=70 /DNA_END=1235 /DNA_ORIENTATION=+